MAKKSTYNELKQIEKILKNHAGDAKKAGEDLSKMEILLKTICNVSSVGITISDKDDILIWANDRMAQMFGMTKNEFLKSTIQDITPSEEMELIKKRRESFFEGEMDYLRVEKGYYHKDGSIFWVDLSISPIRDKDGNILAFVGMNVDITDRKNIEEALRESEEKYKTLYEEAPVSYLEFDGQGRISNVNKKGLEVFGYTAEEMLGELAWNLVEEKEKGKRLIRAKLAGKRPPSKELERTFVRKNRTTFIGLIEDEVFRDKTDRIIGIRSTIQDITDRKQAEESLRDSEQKFRSITEQSPDVIALTDVQGVISYVSPYSERLFGFKTDEMIGRHFMEFLDESSIPIAMRKFRESVDKGHPMKNLELLMKRKDGSNFHGEITGKSFDFASKHGTLVVFRDITDRKQTEEALRESERRYRELADSLPQVVFETDIEGKITYASNIAFNFFGYSQQDLDQGLNAMEMLIPEDQHRALNNFQRVLKGEILDGQEYTARRKDSSTFPIVIHSNCIVRDNHTVGLRGIVVDFSKLKQTEEALRESEEFSTSLLEHSSNAILVFNPDTSIRYVNPLFEKLTGFTTEEVLGKKAPYPWWIDDPKYGTIERRKKSIIEGVHGIERRFRKKNGGYSWVEIHVTPIYHNGELSYSLSTWVDITERKKSEKERESLQEKLQRSQKMESLGLLAGGVAHDLNNVLAGIVSYPELLLLDLPEDSKLRKPIETIEESGHRAVSIVQDLLTIARGVATTKEPLNLNDLVNDYLKSPEFKKLEQYNPLVSIKTNFDSTLMNVSGSQVHLRKVVMNLVSNASEAIEGSGSVTISTANRYVDRPLKVYDDVKIGEYAVLSVSDDGPGITSVDLERIFEPFYSKKVMGRSGTGLGLAVVWNVIQEHEGYINVTSDEEGTTFDLYFPITREEVSDKDLIIPIEDFKGKGEKILVVDDIENQRNITCKILEKLDYTADAVSNGEKAVEYLKENCVDLILLDMIMDPGINGRETYERIIKIHPGQKAIIVSGFAETAEVKEAQRLGAGQYVKKPLTLQKVGLAIKEELKKF